MEGFLDFIYIRQSFFRGHCISVNTTSHSTLRNITSQSYFKPTNRDHLNNYRYCNCSYLYYVFFILFNFYLAMLHKYR